MGAKDSKPQADAAKAQDIVESVSKGRPQWTAKRTRHLEEVHSRMRSDAESFTPPPRLVSDDSVKAPPATSDPNDPAWVKYLTTKYEQRREKLPPAATSQGSSSQTAKPAAIALQMSEYLRLLKAGESKDQPGRRSEQIPPTVTSSSFGKGPSVGSLKSDLTGAIDAIIQKRKDPLAGRRQLSSSGKPAGEGMDKHDALQRIVQMFEASGQDQSKRFPGAEVQVETEAAAITARDDIDVERTNRDNDLAELVYWSDDEKALQNVHRASAHKFALLRPRLPRGTTAKLAKNGYVMQDLDIDLDHEIAVLLLHCRRLHERSISFKDVVDPKRFYVVGVKEVARNVRQQRVKCVLVAPDLEDSTASSGLDDRIREIMRSAYDQDVPVIYGLSRFRIGRALGKSLRMSVIGILDTSGMQSQFDTVLDMAYEKRVSWILRQRSASSGMSSKKEEKPWSKSQAPPGVWHDPPKLPRGAQEESTVL